MQSIEFHLVGDQKLTPEEWVVVKRLARNFQEELEARGFDPALYFWEHTER